MGTSIVTVNVRFTPTADFALREFEENVPACLNLALTAISVFYWYSFIPTRNVYFLYGF